MGSLLSAKKCGKINYLQGDDFEPAEKRVMMETLAVGYDAGPDTLRRTIQCNRVKPIQALDTSKYRCVNDEEDLLLKDDGNMILVASRSLLNHIFVVLNLVNLFAGKRLKQVQKKLREWALCSSTQ
uniref:Protein-serine/threonine phosphatase n=1 Tax=Heterorhabditis bacteriophora TaxID=37862 RepID=A0A1I7W8X9_HETBA